MPKVMSLCSMVMMQFSGHQRDAPKQLVSQDEGERGLVTLAAIVGSVAGGAMRPTNAQVGQDHYLLVCFAIVPPARSV
jgi:hypothetical protein